MLLPLARTFPNNRDAFTADGGRMEHPVGVVKNELNAEGNLVDMARVLSHPGFEQIEGKGLYSYPYNPHVTLNFVNDIAPKVDTPAVRTVSSNVSIPTPEVFEDTFIHEIWLAGPGELSTVAEMARVFYSYWRKALPVGQYCGWQPFDLPTTQRHRVRIMSVQIGGVDFSYKEVREYADRRDPGYLQEQLTLVLKTEKSTIPPKGQLSIKGL